MAQRRPPVPHTPLSRVWSRCWDHRPQGRPWDWFLPGGWESGLAGKELGALSTPFSSSAG